MGMGGGSGLPSFPASLSSISSSGPGGNHNLPYPHPSLASNNSNSGPNSNDQPPPPNGPEEGSWLDFLSFPTNRVDASSLTGLSALGGLGLGGLMDRESATRTSTNLSGDLPGSTTSLFDYAFGGGPAPGSGGGGNNATSGGGNSNHASDGLGQGSRKREGGSSGRDAG
ncbi:hypothetical protein CPB86DRAFT_585835 [Serendipita vermifera]|nr:hypothetical protein CPB86DRAFT_585835 [Serendipita vermifera]